MSTSTLDFNQRALCHHPWGMRRCKNYAAWQNPSKMAENCSNLYFPVIVSDDDAAAAGCCENPADERSSIERSQKIFLDEVLSDCFWCPLCRGEQTGSFAALQAQGCSLALAFHTHSAVKACDRSQTLQPTVPSYPHPCCWANYEYSVAMKVILSDMQLSSQIVSVVLFVVFEGRISQGRDRSSPSDFRYVWWQKLSVRWPKCIMFG